MGRLYWLGGGSGNNRSSSAKREKITREIKETGCMCAVFHLFHFHRNYSSTHPNVYPFLHQEATSSTTGLEAPRNSLELLPNVSAAIDEEASTPLKQQDHSNLNLNLPVGIMTKIKTSQGRKPTNSRIDENISSNCNSPSVVARLMGLESTSPSISTSNKSRKDTCLLQRSFFDVDPLSVRSLPETPRTSSSSRKSDVERHRLSLQINKEKEIFSLPDGRRGKSDGRRSFGADITNKNQSTDQNLSLLNPNKRVYKHGDENNNNPQSKIKQKSSRISSSFLINHQEQQQQQQKTKVVSKKLPARGGDNQRRREDGFVRSRERNVNKVELTENIKSKRRPLSCPTLTHTKLPQKKSQVSDSLSPKSNTQLSSKPTVSPRSTNGGATALHGGASPEQRNCIHTIFKHTGIINQVNSLSFPAGGKGGLRVVEELCKKIDVFPAAKCVVLEDIDSLVERDLCKSELNGFWGEEEDIVCVIEGEIMEWLVRETVAAMGGDAAEERPRTRTGICYVRL